MLESDLDEIVARIAIDDIGIERAEIVFAEQDSGCLSYKIQALGYRWFVKTATTRRGVESLERSVRFHSVVRHPAIVHPARTLGSSEPILLYPWVPGQVLNHATRAGSDRRGLGRFRQLPVSAVAAAISAVLAAHDCVAVDGFIAVDFYDGCLLYDFEASAMRLIDLDEYRPGPFVLDVDRLPGSRSYMAPEEFRPGAVIDQRTNVFTLGRLIHHLLDTPGGWRGTSEQATLVRQATKPSPGERYATVHDLVQAWTLTTGPDR